MKIRVDYTSKELNQLRVEAITNITNYINDGLPEDYYSQWIQYLTHWTNCSIEDIALSLAASVSWGEDYHKFDFEHEVYINGVKIEGKPKFYLIFKNYEGYDWKNCFEYNEYRDAEWERFFGGNN